MSAASGACARGARGAAPCCTRRRDQGRCAWTTATTSAARQRRLATCRCRDSWPQRITTFSIARRIQASRPRPPCAAPACAGRSAPRPWRAPPGRAGAVAPGSAPGARGPRRWRARRREAPAGPSAPSSTSSGMPEMRLATTGRPQLMASISATGMPSRRPSRSWTLGSDQDVRGAHPLEHDVVRERTVEVARARRARARDLAARARARAARRRPGGSGRRRRARAAGGRPRSGARVP